MFFVLTVSHSPCSTVYGGSIVLTSTVAVATLIGGTSGFLGGKLDLAVQRFVGVELELPRRGPMRAPASISPSNRSDHSASASVTERGKRPVLEKSVGKPVKTGRRG